MGIDRQNRGDRAHRSAASVDCRCVKPSSPISHMTFWTLNELRRPRLQHFGLTGVQRWLLSHFSRTLRIAADCERQSEDDHESSERAADRIVAAAVAGLAAAQDFPNKPIKLIVPFPAGGPNDIIARMVGQRMSELMKQPVVIDNRGGQGGVLGTDAVAKAQPDGYTIGDLSASALAINPSMEKVAYDVAEGFAPITLVVTVPEMLVVATNVPANNMANWSRSPRRSPESSILHPPAPAACRIWPANCSSSPRRSTSCTCPIAAPRRRSTICWASRCR